ncbi:MAG: hypothetical protein LBJ94_01490 [Puniceicoccales bacterium]|jgi:hypothetical protein|nr:hypothetical protein [Puniceicoccales bacterium]
MVVGAIIGRAKALKNAANGETVIGKMSAYGKRGCAGGSAGQNNLIGEHLVGEQAAMLRMSLLGLGKNFSTPGTERRVVELQPYCYRALFSQIETLQISLRAVQADKRRVLEKIAELFSPIERCISQPISVDKLQAVMEESRKLNAQWQLQDLRELILTKPGSYASGSDNLEDTQEEIIDSKVRMGTPLSGKDMNELQTLIDEAAKAGAKAEQCKKALDAKLIELIGKPTSSEKIRELQQLKTNLQEELQARLNPISGALDSIKIFIQNDVKPADAPTLKAALAALANDRKVIIIGDHSYAISECDHLWACRNMNLQIEELVILLHAKEIGQEGIGIGASLGSGLVHSVHRAQSNDGRLVALKLCDRAKQRKNEEDFRLSVRMVNFHIGRVSGNFSRNLASSGLQDMLTAIGRSRPKPIKVPSVMVSATAAEANGEAYIAMDYVEGKDANNTPIPRDETLSFRQELEEGESLRRETWLQLMDVLTGQVDRNATNVIFDESKRPISIDHDLSFPTNPPRSFAGTVPNKIYEMETICGRWRNMAADGQHGFNYCMPPAIDREMYDVVMALDAKPNGALERLYKRCMLPDNAIGAAMERARELQSRVSAIPSKNLVIDWLFQAKLLRDPLCNGEWAKVSYTTFHRPLEGTF